MSGFLSVRVAGKRTYAGSPSSTTSTPMDMRCSASPREGRPRTGAQRNPSAVRSNSPTGTSERTASHLASSTLRVSAVSMYSLSMSGLGGADLAERRTRAARRSAGLFVLAALARGDPLFAFAEPLGLPAQAWDETFSHLFAISAAACLLVHAWPAAFCVFACALQRRAWPVSAAWLALLACWPADARWTVAASLGWCCGWHAGGGCELALAGAAPVLALGVRSVWMAPLAAALACWYGTAEWPPVRHARLCTRLAVVARFAFAA